MILNIIKNSAITFLFLIAMYLLFAFEKYILLTIIFIVFLLFCVNEIWKFVHNKRIKNPDYIAKDVAKGLKIWRKNTGVQFWINKGDIRYLNIQDEFNKYEPVYFKLWERFAHDKNKRLEIVRDWATFVKSSIQIIDIDLEDADSETQQTYNYLSIRINEIKKRFDKLSKE
jgi:hypothetical protein